MALFLEASSRTAAPRPVRGSRRSSGALLREVRERRGGAQSRSSSKHAPRGEVKVAPRQRARAVRRRREEWTGAPSTRISRAVVPLWW